MPKGKKPSIKNKLALAHRCGCLPQPPPPPVARRRSKLAEHGSNSAVFQVRRLPSSVCCRSTQKQKNKVTRSKHVNSPFESRKLAFLCKLRPPRFPPTPSVPVCQPITCDIFGVAASSRLQTNNERGQPVAHPPRSPVSPSRCVRPIAVTAATPQ